jgi:hypothetical protein
MPALHVALGWRLGWPASLACAGWHVLCRYDDRQRTFNIEATNTGKGGFHAHPDAYYRERYNLTAESIRSGSSLRALSPRELLGLFVGFRARLHQDTGRAADALADYRLASRLCPRHEPLRTRAAELVR